ncbi:hypothetical protein IQ07DRAFT_244489 [Pyrenochaeta sp. DS3sAY3a]|nr:hypothetical protein IQ07DRAFT_244489 [Pyrenochaeta sp. DS3sAY3a]
MQVAASFIRSPNLFASLAPVCDFSASSHFDFPVFSSAALQVRAATQLASQPRRSPSASALCLVHVHVSNVGVPQVGLFFQKPHPCL